MFDFLLRPALAQAPAPPAAPGLLDFLPLIAVFAVFYFLLLRPNLQRQKEHRKMLEALAKGDEAVTSGGLLGRVTEVGTSFVSLEVAKGVEVKVQKLAIASVVPKGTTKTL